MVSMAESVASIASGISAALGGPYQAATVTRWTDAEYDEGGSIVTPAQPVNRACKAQVSIPTAQARIADGFTEKEVWVIILAASLAGDLDTDMSVSIDTGPFAGTSWLLKAPLSLDSMGVTWKAKGSPA